jgi:glutathione synthase/RimK-type ligase-like ATP-grasp enzyme
VTPRAIGLATFAGEPALTEDDRLLAAELRRRGARAEALVWDDPAVRWAAFDRVVLRSCWDYHRRPAEFLAWIDRLEGEGVPVSNPPALVRANAHKSYLRDLQAAGVPILPTAWLPRGSRADLEAVLAERGWPEAVVKPAVSASAHGTWRTDRARARQDQRLLDEMLERGEALVQPFAPEVARQGEWSFVFLGGGYSHAVLKRPAEGDFRVQTELGGRADALPPPPSLRGQAEAVLQRVEGWLYARVDGIDREGTLVVLELELIEPFLFLADDPAAPSRFAEAILAL